MEPARPDSKSPSPADSKRKYQQKPLMVLSEVAFKAKIVGPTLSTLFWLSNIGDRGNGGK